VGERSKASSTFFEMEGGGKANDEKRGEEGGQRGKREVKVW
jgi:hypothetical protein